MENEIGGGEGFPISARSVDMSACVYIYMPMMLRTKITYNNGFWWFTFQLFYLNSHSFDIFVCIL